MIKTISFLIFSFFIVLQPASNPRYVASSGVTRFQLAENIGLLAHNYTEEGKAFSKIKIGDIIYIDKTPYLVYNRITYEVRDNLFITESNQFNELEVFNSVYKDKSDLTLQTCVEKNGNRTWGRLFILANTHKVCIKGYEK